LRSSKRGNATSTQLFIAAATPELRGFDPSATITGVLSGFGSVSHPGDYHENGVFDAADYVVCHSTLGQSGAGFALDGNCYNQIDPGNYFVWRGHFDRTAGSGARADANASAPELANAGLINASDTGQQSTHLRSVSRDEQK
jgi:hypothetical protein